MIVRKRLQKIPEALMLKVRLKLDELIRMINPYFIALSEAERRSLAVIGDEPFKFIEMCHNMSIEYTELFPSFLNTAILKEEFFTAHELWQFAKRIDQLKNDIIDIEMLAGNNALEIALAFYHTVKIAARHDIPGARIIYNELKSSFPPKKHRIP